jgi:hypothetical protein
MKKQINILGVEIDKENLPFVYRWAEVNKPGLENTIRKMQAVDNSSVSTILVTLEIEFGNNS